MSNLNRLTREIQLETRGLLQRWKAAEFERRGGIVDPHVAHERMIEELGPARAAEMTLRLSRLRRQMHNLYGLSPTLAFEHVQTIRELLQRGWLTRTPISRAPK